MEESLALPDLWDLLQQGSLWHPWPQLYKLLANEAEWRNLQEQGFSPDIINMLLSSLQVSTKESIVDYGEHPFSASIRLILAFLQSLFNNGLSYNTINVYRS